MNYIHYHYEKYTIYRSGGRFVWENYDRTNRLGNPPENRPDRRVWAYGALTKGNPGKEEGLSFESEWDAIEWGREAADHEFNRPASTVSSYSCEAYRELDDWDDHR